MSIEEDYAVNEIRSLAKRVQRLEDEAGITEADAKAAKEAKAAEREADERGTEGDGDERRNPREVAAAQADNDPAAQATQAQADNDGPAGITEASRSADTDEGPTKDPQNEGDDVDATKSGQPEPEFDPSRHTINEVKAHLRSAGDAERDRVLAAERAGQNRTGIVGEKTGTPGGGPA